MKVLIACISLLEWSRRVALSFFSVQSGRNLVWIECFLDLLHILLELLGGYSFFRQPHLNGMVRATHAKQEHKHLVDGRARLFTPTGLTGITNRSDQFYC
jgi:hypothetical protein